MPRDTKWCWTKWHVQWEGRMCGKPSLGFLSPLTSLFCMSSWPPDWQVLWDQNTFRTPLIDGDLIPDLSHRHGRGQGWLLCTILPGSPGATREWVGQLGTSVYPCIRAKGGQVKELISEKEGNRNSAGFAVASEFKEWEPYPPARQIHEQRANVQAGYHGAHL